MKVKYVFVVLLSFLFNQIYANSDTLNLSLDREVPLYYNGDYVQFVLAMPNALKTVDYPIACKLVIQDSVGNNIIEKLLYLEQPMFESAIKIPDNIVSGKYILNCGIINDKLSNINVHQSEIYFINIKTFRQRETGSSKREVIAVLSEESYKNPAAIIGTVLPSKNNTLDHTLVVMQSRGDTEVFEYTLVDSSGNFQFSNPFFGRNEIYILIIGSAYDDYSLQLTKIPYSLKKGAISMKPFKLPPDLLKLDSVRNYVVKYNYLPNGDKVQDYKKEKLIVYDKTINVDDYIALPTTLDIVKEIIPLKKIKKQQIYLLNSSSNSYFKSPPLILIDGFIASSYEDILALDRDEIESFSLSYSPTANFSLMGRYSRYGILSITTRSKKHYPKFGKVYSFEGFIKSN